MNDITFAPGPHGLRLPFPCMAEPDTGGNPSGSPLCCTSGKYVFCCTFNLKF